MLENEDTPTPDGGFGAIPGAEPLTPPKTVEETPPATNAEPVTEPPAEPLAATDGPLAPPADAEEIPDDYKPKDAPVLPASGMQINPVAGKPPVASPASSEVKEEIPDCRYEAEAKQVDEMLTKMYVDGKRDEKYLEHRAEAIRTLKIALYSLVHIN